MWLNVSETHINITYYLWHVQYILVVRAKLCYSLSSILMPPEMLFNWELPLLNTESTWYLLLWISHAYEILIFGAQAVSVSLSIEFSEMDELSGVWGKIVFLVCLITTQVVYHVFWDEFLNPVFMLFWLPHVLIVKLIFCDSTQKAPFYKSKVNISPYLAGVP